MTATLANVTVDCHDALAVGTFWSAVLGRPLAAEPPASQDFAMIGALDHSTPGGAVNWLFLRVPEKKTAKNRMHVDLAADDRAAVHSEVARLVALGATVVRDPQEEFGNYWATLQDPEGNEFCVGAT
jgi:catechol 2,3-dioxygenase-like lactoylglutathione lyase family enzyme